MKIFRRWNFVFIVALVLIIVFIGVDSYIKLSFGTGYSNVSYRFANEDIQDFFKSIKYDDNMSIGMMQLYFDNNGRVIGMDMNFLKETDNPNLKDQYKSSYNMQGAGLTNLYYTGFLKQINSDSPTDQIWKNSTPKILKALSSFPTDEFYNVIPKANIYNISIRDILEIENYWSTSNEYVVENGSIHKITSEDNLKGV
ncbi:MAG: hypothetical protein PHI52_10140 [Bacteroidales bacterium]|nr:hypothetical protein [Bacteroidales bacterium]